MADVGINVAACLYYLSLNNIVTGFRSGSFNTAKTELIDEPFGPV
jgi:hypothetical protein